MIHVSNLSFSYGLEPVFDQVNFSVGIGQKVGLVGVNGAGKSTLLKLLTQEEEYADGKIGIDGTIGYVPQEVTRDSALENALTIRDYIDPNKTKGDFELKTLLSDLELSLSLAEKPKELSGGQKTKLALARALTAQQDILLLDEPTNFMDTAGKKWVMSFLSNYPKTLVLISHDLALMDKAIEKVLFINKQTKKIEEYTGNYTKFKKLQKTNEELQKRHILAEQKHIKRMEKSLEKLRRFTSDKGVRARVLLQKRIERLKSELPELPKEVKKIKLSLPSPLPIGEMPIRAKGISKSFGDKTVFENLDFSIVRGQRVALIGKNGAGKTTLINILVGRMDPDAGEVIRNDQLNIGHYSQEFETFDMEKSVLDTLIDACGVTQSFARPFLGKFMFLGKKVFQSVGTLSGGEKTRLSIALLTAKPHNLLVLDEPTTYLDVLSQRIILDALKSYRGTMIIVSHTPQFVAELNPHRAFLLPEKKMDFFDEEILERIGEI